MIKEHGVSGIMIARYPTIPAMEAWIYSWARPIRLGPHGRECGWEHGQGAEWPPIRPCADCGCLQTIESAFKQQESAQGPSVDPGSRGPATRPPGHPATRPPGHPATRRPGGPLARRPSHPSARSPGGSPANPSVRPPGHPTARSPPYRLLASRPGQLGKANLSYAGRHRRTYVALSVCRLARSNGR